MAKFWSIVLWWILYTIVHFNGLINNKYIFILLINPLIGSYKVSLGFKHIASNKINPNAKTSAFNKIKTLWKFSLRYYKFGS